MLRSQPAFPPFAARANLKMIELTDRGTNRTFAAGALGSVLLNMISNLTVPSFFGLRAQVAQNIQSM